MDAAVEATPRAYRIDPGELLLTAGAGGAPTMPAGEILPKTGEQLAGEAYSQIRKDLYLSFMLSQGQDRDQSQWLRAAAAYYKSTWPDEKIEQLPAALSKMDEAIALTTDDQNAPSTAQRSGPSPMQVPGKHKPAIEKARVERQLSRSEQFNDHWNTFRDWITTTDPTTEGEKKLTMPAGQPASLAASLAQRDLMYQSPDRPRTGGHIFAASDPHSSLFKTHVVDGVSTGSEAYDAVFGTIRSLYNTAATNDELRATPQVESMMEAVVKLRDGWQPNHPGEVFDAEPLRSEAIDATRAALGNLATTSA